MKAISEITQEMSLTTTSTSLTNSSRTSLQVVNNLYAVTEKPATKDEIETALKLFSQLVGYTKPEQLERLAPIKLMLQVDKWTPSEISKASRYLATNHDYNFAITYRDFARARDKQPKIYTKEQYMELPTEHKNRCKWVTNDGVNVHITDCELDELPYGWQERELKPQPKPQAKEVTRDGMVNSLSNEVMSLRKERDDLEEKYTKLLRISDNQQKNISALRAENEVLKMELEKREAI